MKFCPECGTMLMPQEKGKNTWLVCPNCESYQKLKEEDDYKIKEERREGKEKKVVVVEEESGVEIREPDYDLDTDAAMEFYEES